MECERDVCADATHVCARPRETYACATHSHARHSSNACVCAGYVCARDGIRRVIGVTVCGKSGGGGMRCAHAGVRQLRTCAHVTRLYARCVRASRASACDEACVRVCAMRGRGVRSHAFCACMHDALPMNCLLCLRARSMWAFVYTVLGQSSISDVRMRA